MADWFNEVTWSVLAGLAALNLLVLLSATKSAPGAWIRARASKALRAPSGRSDLQWLDWKPLTAAAGIAFATVSAYGIRSGQYGCHPPGVSDPIGVLSSGKAFWAGTDPFQVVDCGRRFVWVGLGSPGRSEIECTARIGASTIRPIPPDENGLNRFYELSRRSSEITCSNRGSFLAAASIGA
jgi:hypothetical protein